MRMIAPFSLQTKICFCAFLLNVTPSDTFRHSPYINLRWGGGGGAKYAPLLFFLHHPKKAQGINLKLSDFKDTPLTQKFCKSNQFVTF